MESSEHAAHALVIGHIAQLYHKSADQRWIQPGEQLHTIFPVEPAERLGQLLPVRFRKRSGTAQGGLCRLLRIQTKGMIAGQDSGQQEDPLPVA